LFPKQKPQSLPNLHTEQECSNFELCKTNFSSKKLNFNHHKNYSLVQEFNNFLYKLGSRIRSKGRGEVEIKNTIFKYHTEKFSTKKNFSNFFLSLKSHKHTHISHKSEASNTHTNTKKIKKRREKERERGKTKFQTFFFRSDCFGKALGVFECRFEFKRS
jgi:hypothetical protein